MKKLVVAMAALCLLSTVSFANGDKNKRNKQAVKKEQKVKVKKTECCPDNCPVPVCSPACPKPGCSRS